MRWKSILGLAAVLCVSGTVLAAPRGVLPRHGRFSDANVAKAISDGVKYLLSSQGADGSWPGHGGKYFVGPTAIATYAILESDEVKATDPRMKKALEWLCKHQVPGRVMAAARANRGKPQSSESYTNKTYEIGLRANALLAAVKRTGMRNSPYLPYLRNDVAMLYLSTRDGSYGYDSYGNGQSSGDNSNSQYGVLGVWAGVQADLEVPRKYWYTVLKHWVGCQTGDGGWSYHGNRGASATMCTAGLASMFLCYDNLLQDGFVKCDQGPKTQAVLRPLNKGLEWMDSHFEGAINGRDRGIGNIFYLLYGVERVGLASGYKYFGKADWYKIGAEKLLGMQGGSGAWEAGGYGAVVNTSYALLFLVRGRHAILFNKLDFNGDWNNRPRDLASLTRTIGRGFEESTINWQIVNLKVPAGEWLDAPILYISASKAPEFTDEQIATIRRYVNMGGTIFSCTECGGRGFSDGIREVYKKMFPKYELKPMPTDHKIFTINFKLDSRRGELAGMQMIHNGVRPLVIHTDRDLPRSWQLQLSTTDKPAFQFPSNMALYLTDGAIGEKKLAGRGATSWPAKPEFKPVKEVSVARLSYKTTDGKEGNCDPEPLAWQRFSRMMGEKYKVDVKVSDLMPISQLADSNANVAVLCGTDRIAATDDEIKAIQSFVAGGGLLYMEAVGGAWGNRNAAGFAESGGLLAREIARGLPDSMTTRKTVRRLTSESPLYTQKGFEIEDRDIKYRNFAKLSGGMVDGRPMFQGVLDTNNMPLLLFSNEDVTGGLVGYACDEVLGYMPKSAFDLMRNVVMTKAHAPTPPATQPATAPADKGGAPK